MLPMCCPMLCWIWCSDETCCCSDARLCAVADSSLLLARSAAALALAAAVAAALAPAFLGAGPLRCAISFNEEETVDRKETHLDELERLLGIGAEVWMLELPRLRARQPVRNALLCTGTTHMIAIDALSAL